MLGNPSVVWTKVMNQGDATRTANLSEPEISDS